MDHSLNWYRWNTDIGEILVCATSPGSFLESDRAAKLVNLSECREMFS